MLIELILDYVVINVAYKIVCRVIYTEKAYDLKEVESQNSRHTCTIFQRFCRGMFFETDRKKSWNLFQIEWSKMKKRIYLSHKLTQHNDQN